ncbi:MULTISPECIES: MFS transporter [Aquimarina]|uniref:MFS transporter n=1 Tax=Aquimarina algiphila TaxID=2047982 RepID=A0A554VCR1_9FLAO|nr:MULTISPECIES: MFS transporter [Aquimarina]TSE04577.1 MFS transporter [Aquimarina algiphila]
MKDKKGSIYTINFALISLSSLLFSASYNMLIPELPAYLSSINGAEYKGLIISLFTLTAGLSRPFSGKLTDTIGRKPVIVIGAMVCLVSGFLYPILTTVSGFLFLRLLHGFSTGFSPTAISAYVSDIIPRERWGEALGIQGLCFSTGLALGPALGSFIRLHYSFDILFYTSSCIALISIIMVVGIKETLVHKKTFSFSDLRISKNDIIAREVLPSALITFLTYIGFGVILTLIPDWSDHLGIINKGTFFIVFTASSLLIRVIAGKISDAYGRIPVINIGLVILFIALILIGYLNTIKGLLTGAVFYGLAMGILSPALNAWTVDMSDPNHKGKAMATMYIALEAGIGLGAFFSGVYYQDIISKIPLIMYICAAMAAVGLLYMLFRKKS